MADSSIHTFVSTTDSNMQGFHAVFFFLQVRQCIWKSLGELQSGTGLREQKWHMAIWPPAVEKLTVTARSDLQNKALQLLYRFNLIWLLICAFTQTQ